MSENTPRQELIREISGTLVSIGDHSSSLENSPGMKEQVVRLISMLRSALYPHIFGAASAADSASSAVAVECRLQSAARLLELLLSVLHPSGEDNAGLVLRFLRLLPEIKRTLETDIQAAFEGDPAARNTDEIMLAYPAFEAISIFRLAHELYAMQVPMLPRMMTEYAHQLTGIDIHPGATIGGYFFIDHGTGVVIGETTTIGHHVKLYQGVTLGAKSFQLDENGNPVKGIKRHPDIGSHVVIYAGATILGGNTQIGDHCVIGGNVWLTHSVESGRTVLAAEERGTKII